MTLVRARTVANADSRLLCQVRRSGGLRKRGRVAAVVVVPHASYDLVGELAFVGSSGFSGCLALAAFAGDELLGWFVEADLGDVHGVEHRVDLPVATKVEPVTGWVAAALAGRRSDGSDTTPLGKRAFVAEACWVADLDEEVHGAHGGDADVFGQGGPELVEKSRNLSVEVADAAVETVDVFGRVGETGQVHTVSSRDVERVRCASSDCFQARSHPAGGGQGRTDPQRQTGEGPLGFVEKSDPLTHKAFAAVSDCDQLLPYWIGLVLFPGRREVIMGQCFSSDCLSVLTVGLLAASSATTLGCAVRLHFADVEAGSARWGLSSFLCEVVVHVVGSRRPGKVMANALSACFHPWVPVPSSPPLLFPMLRIAK